MSMLLAACGENSSETPAPAITSLQVSPASSSTPVGFGVQFDAKVVLDDGSSMDVTHDASVTWGVSDAAIAAVSGGMVTGLAPGSVTITASSTVDGKLLTASAQLEVTNAVVTSLQVTPLTSRLAVGLQQHYVAMAIFSDDTSLDVTNAAALTWSTTDGSIASVSNDATKKGRVTALAVGDVEVIASGAANGANFSSQVTLTVSDATINALRLEPQPVNTDVRVPAGFTLQFHAIATLTDGSEQDITDNDALSWRIGTGADIASVDNADSKGLATGITAGQASVIASGAINGAPYKASAPLTVTDAVVTALQITPNPGSTLNLPIGTQLQFTAIAIFSDGTTLDVTRQPRLTWNDGSVGSEPSVVGIQDGGLRKGRVTALRLGNATIGAALSVGHAPIVAPGVPVTVTDAVVTSLRIESEPFGSLQSIRLPIGLSRQLAAWAIMSDGRVLDVTDNDALHWASSDDTAVVVTNDASKGLLTSLAPGSATITIRGAVGGVVLSDELNVTVTDAVMTKLAIEPVGSVPAAGLPAGLQVQYMVSAIYSDGSSFDLDVEPGLTWSSSAPEVASIDRSNWGRVTAVSPGQATITVFGVHDNGLPYSATATLTVSSAAVTALRIEPQSAGGSLVTVPAGMTQQFQAFATLTDGTEQDVTGSIGLNWRIGKGGATVNSSDEKGLVTGTAVGEASVIASGTFNETPYRASASFEVTRATLTGVAVAPVANIGLADRIIKAHPKDFVATGTFSDGSTADLTRLAAWSSSDEGVVGIRIGGHAFGNGVGTASITATVNGIASAAVDLSVEELKMCGIGINDADPANAETDCIKVGQNGDGAPLVTGSPSQSAFTLMGYTGQASSATGERFTYFSNGVGVTQQERIYLCEDLSAIGFAGRVNWLPANNNTLSSFTQATVGPVELFWRMPPARNVGGGGYSSGFYFGDPDTAVNVAAQGGITSSPTHSLGGACMSESN